MAGEGVESRLCVLAQVGDLDELLNLVDISVDDADYLAYKWLTAASDFGHDDADELVDAVLAGPLHADDDNLVTGHAHFELAVAYLTGDHGVPVDHDRACRHLGEIATRRYPRYVQDGCKDRRGMSQALTSAKTRRLRMPGWRG